MAHARPKSSIPLPKSPASPKGVYQASFSSAPSPAKQYLQYNTTRLIDDKRLEMYRRRNQTEAYDSEPNEKASKPQKYHYETQSKKPTDAKAQKSPRSGEKDEKRLDPRWINRRTLREDLISVDTSGATKGTGLPRHRFAAKKPQKEPEIRPTRKQSPVREKTEPERTKKEQKIKDDVRAKLKSQTKFSVPEERPKTAGGARRPQSSAGKKKNTETSAAKPTFDDKDKPKRTFEMQPATVEPITLRHKRQKHPVDGSSSSVNRTGATDLQGDTMDHAKVKTFVRAPQRGMHDVEKETYQKMKDFYKKVHRGVDEASPSEKRSKDKTIEDLAGYAKSKRTPDARQRDCTPREEAEGCTPSGRVLRTSAATSTDPGKAVSSDDDYYSSQDTQRRSQPGTPRSQKDIDNDYTNLLKTLNALNPTTLSFSSSSSTVGKSKLAEDVGEPRKKVEEYFFPPEGARMREYRQYDPRMDEGEVFRPEMKPRGRTLIGEPYPDRRMRSQALQTTADVSSQVIQKQNSPTNTTPHPSTPRSGVRPKTAEFPPKNNSDPPSTTNTSTIPESTRKLPKGRPGTSGKSDYRVKMEGAWSANPGDARVLLRKFPKISYKQAEEMVRQREAMERIRNGRNAEEIEGYFRRKLREGQKDDAKSPGSGCSRGRSERSRIAKEDVDRGHHRPGTVPDQKNFHRPPRESVGGSKTSLPSAPDPFGYPRAAGNTFLGEDNRRSRSRSHRENLRAGGTPSDESTTYQPSCPVQAPYDVTTPDSDGTCSSTTLSTTTSSSVSCRRTCSRIIKCPTFRTRSMEKLMMSESKGSCRKPSGFMEDELGCKCAKTSERIDYCACDPNIYNIAMIERMVREETELIDNTIHLIGDPLCESLSRASVKMKLSALKEKCRSVKIIEESLEQNVPHDDDGEEVQADMIAALMQQVESGTLAQAVTRRRSCPRMSRRGSGSRCSRKEPSSSRRSSACCQSGRKKDSKPDSTDPRYDLEAEFPDMCEDFAGARFDVLSESNSSDPDQIDDVDYISDTQTPRHFTNVQLRGSSLPTWFPGFFSTFTTCEEGVLNVEKRPSAVFKNAWNAFAPEEVIQNSEIVIV